MSVYPDLKAELSNNSFSSSPQRKVLYFSDGTLEVSETDGEENFESSTKSGPTSVSVNPQELSWIPWMWYQTLTAGSKALEVCDYLGESLASFFGITTPKYQFEINEYNRIKKEEEEENQNDLELGNWTGTNKSLDLEGNISNTKGF